ncbi:MULTISPECIES: class II fructose-bisphosphatase [unclassified Candidatus Frackibacter]|uniref:class II fructose-bisphosphatase n=1 Tax=unclassified Candidatus Frackibacter TaxID=2648818 RepID=UPI0008831FD2|nr:MULTISPECIES: class II fructose-bisphosphatase [unclassified Candidatus Frackibacter]SDC63557.1 fructose-1,6-bisphosphatase II [Candidatus Frackibacter sp. WG11]SEM78221.1 fructose-1,6-bisphosphatase II [Candidatus Frackibacter sp. WG12]SFL87902.1 fructose-1,6-bisphosphatase II [Candidatus Frackibacter sp. WG13]
MERELALEFVRVTEAAALAAAPWMGKGDKISADQAAVDAMRAVFDTVNIKGTVVIGEGEKDEAPMLYIGEEIGCSESPELDIAVDPVEGTTLVARGLPNSLAVVAAAKKGNLLKTPAWYMKKIAVGPQAKGAIDIQATPTENLKSVAAAKGKKVEDLTIIILDRPRHEEIIKEIREAGARIKLITDGDVAGGIATALEHTGVDILMGIGGAPEGVLTAAALKCLGGEIQAQLRPRDDEEYEEAKAEGLADPKKILTTDDLAKGEDVMFSVTGITNGELLKGVQYHGNQAETHSIVMRSKTGTIRNIKAEHKINQKPSYFKKQVINNI